MKRPVWCFECADKGLMRSAKRMIPARHHAYGLLKDGAIDKRLIGVCDECYSRASKFRRDSYKDIDRSNPDLVNASL